MLHTIIFNGVASVVVYYLLLWYEIINCTFHLFPGFKFNVIFKGEVERFEDFTGK